MSVPKGGAASELTLLISDIEGSTRRWEHEPDTMAELMRLHDDIVDEVIAATGGSVVKRTGDGALGAFPDAAAAVVAAIEMQRRLSQARAAGGSPLSVRMAVHSGVLEARAGDLHGPAAHRAARMMSTAHGGQIVVSGLVAVALPVGRLASGVISVGDVGLRPLGRHRVRDLVDPVDLYQVVAEGLETSFPPLRSENAGSGNLPQAFSTLVGRDGVPSQIANLVADRTVLTLVGPAGVGKTLLALHVGTLARAEFPDGVWFVDLAKVSDERHLVSAMFESLGLTLPPNHEAIARLREVCAGRRMLAIIDNCEHLVEAVATLLREVAGPVGTTAFLCTSQRRLEVPEEHVYDVEPLDVSSATASPSAAATMFIARADVTKPGFAATLDAESTQAVDAICTRLDGLPLALELAAARVAVLEPSQIAARLDDAFDLLRRRHGTPRHRSLHGAIAWSVGLLADDDREVLRAVSRFQGPFELDAAVALSAAPDTVVVDSMAELVARSLVRRDAAGYRLLDSVRRFAAQELADVGAAAAVATRHARWYYQRVTDLRDDVDVNTVVVRLDWLSLHHDDVRLALARLIEHDPRSAATMAETMTDFWTTRGHIDEGIHWLERCVAATPDPEQRIALLSWASGMGWIAGRNRDSATWARAALDQAAEAKLPYPAYAAGRLAVHCAFNGDVEAALALVREAESVALGDPEVGSRVLGVLGVVAGVAGQRERSVQLCDQGVEFSRHIGAMRTCVALMNRMVITPGDDSVNAIAAEVLRLSEPLGRRSGTGQALLALAHLRRAAGSMRGFLEHIAECCVALLDDQQRTAVVNVLDYVPGAIADAEPYHAAHFLAALERLHEEIGQVGMPTTREEREHAARQVHDALDGETQRLVRNEAQLATVEDAIDRVRWLAVNGNWTAPIVDDVQLVVQETAGD